MLRANGPATRSGNAIDRRIHRATFHRLAASGALALIIGMLLLGRAPRTAFKRERMLALAALLIAAGLAGLGIATLEPSILPYRSGTCLAVT